MTLEEKVVDCEMLAHDTALNLIEVVEVKNGRTSKVVLEWLTLEARPGTMKLRDAFLRNK
jgi:hypothetical protein